MTRAVGTHIQVGVYRVFITRVFGIACLKCEADIVESFFVNESNGQDAMPVEVGALELRE